MKRQRKPRPGWVFVFSNPELAKQLHCTSLRFQTVVRDATYSQRMTKADAMLAGADWLAESLKVVLSERHRYTRVLDLRFESARRVADTAIVNGVLVEKANP